MDTLVKIGDVLLGKYRVERVLGQGGMGLVVAARHLQLGELFAIKFLLPSTPEQPGQPGQPGQIERFVREARAAARLRSDHVARVHDVGRTEAGAPYMVLEYLQGSDLRDLVREEGPLPVEDAALFVLQACDAIAEAHAAGIVHRDLKPANLFLIRRPNGSPSVKVLDFGVSKQTGVDEVELTTTGAMLGSPVYMAPEQVACSKSVDARADIWAMGVVLYELVTGRRPFDADTVLKLVALVMQAEPALPSELRPDLPRSVEAVILRCMRKRPEERFQSIGELAAALREALPKAAFTALAGATLAHPARSRAALAPGSTPASVPSLALEPTSVAPRGPSSTMATLSIEAREAPAAHVAATPESAPAIVDPSTTVREATPTLRDPSTTIREATPTLREPAYDARRTTGGAPAPRRKAAMAVGAAVGLAVLGGGAWWFVRGRSSGIAAAPATAAPVAAAPADAAAPAAAAALAGAAAPVEGAPPAPPARSTVEAAASAASQQGPAPSGAPTAKAAPAAARAPSARPRGTSSPTQRPTLW